MRFPILLSLAALLPTPAAAQLVVGEHLGGSFGVVWVGTDMDGLAYPTPMVACEFSWVSIVDNTVRFRIRVARSLIVGRNVIPWSEAVKNIPAGQWNVYVRVEDENGVTSPFSPPTRVEVERQGLPKTPMAPPAPEVIPASAPSVLRAPRSAPDAHPAEGVEIRYGGKWLTFKTLAEASRFLQEEADNEQLRRQEQ